MTTSAPEDNEYFRLENVAYDVAQIFGVTTDQGIARARRCLFRAANSIAGFKQKRWSWLTVKDSFNTVEGEDEYSLSDDAKTIHQIWIPGTNRQKLARVPRSEFVERIPNASTTSGFPSIYDEDGVDSSGAKIITLYPVPSSAIEVFYRYTRRMQAPSDPANDIRALWGMPPEMLECLTQKAAALCVQGVNSQRFNDLNAMAESLIAEAYADDQQDVDMRYRAPMQSGERAWSGGPVLPPEYGRE